MSGDSGSTQQGSPRDPDAPATTGQLAQVQQQLQQQLQQEMQQMRQEVLAGFNQLGATLANRRECRCPPDTAEQLLAANAALARMGLEAQSEAAARSSSMGEQHG